MSKEKNPFIVTGKIEPPYFCDRVRESKQLVKSLTNKNNMVIISPRRMGKTGLIQFCYEKPEIKKHYYTFFIDILHTTSLREFTYILGKEIFQTLTPLSKKMITLFAKTLKSINGKFGFDPLTSLPTFNLELGDINKPEFTLEEIFKYLSMADKPCIISIDEFQQIAKYPEKNIEALLRTHIQKRSNSNFVFAGSEKTMMQNMFLSASRPFYRSADVMELKPIEKDIYVDFIVQHFESRNRKIKKKNVEEVYDKFKGHTFYIQKTFNESFADTPSGKECTKEIICAAMETMIDLNATIFRENLSKIPDKHKDLLYAIAKEGEATQILSVDFMKKYSLVSTSAVQFSAKQLLEKDYITEHNKTYSITDKLFAMWIRKIYYQYEIEKN